MLTILAVSTIKFLGDTDLEDFSDTGVEVI
jgi:hypothetical protein